MGFSGSQTWMFHLALPNDLQQQHVVHLPQNTLPQHILFQRGGGGGSQGPVGIQNGGHSQISIINSHEHLQSSSSSSSGQFHHGGGGGGVNGVQASTSAASALSSGSIIMQHSNGHLQRQQISLNELRRVQQQTSSSSTIDINDDYHVMQNSHIVVTNNHNHNNIIINNNNNNRAGLRSYVQSAIGRNSASSTGSGKSMTSSLGTATHTNEDGRRL